MATSCGSRHRRAFTLNGLGADRNLAVRTRSIRTRREAKDAAASSTNRAQVAPRHPVGEDPGHQQPPADGRQLRPTMCHESFPSVVSWISTPSLGRLSLVNNLFVN